MKRIATAAATALVGVVGVVGCGGTGGGGSSSNAAKPAAQAPAKLAAGQHHALGRLHRARAERLQGRRQGLRGAPPRRQGPRRRRHQRRQDHRGEPRRQGARRRAVVLGRQLRRVLRLRRLGRPQALPRSATRSATRSSRPPRAPTRSTRAPAARCRCSPTRMGLYYNEDMLKKAGLNGPPKTISELTAVREEADRAATPTGRSRSSASTRS